MGLPVVQITRGHCRIPNDQQVFCIAFFGLFGKVTKSGNHECSIDNDNCVVSVRVASIDLGNNPRLAQDVTAYLLKAL